VLCEGKGSDKRILHLGIFKENPTFVLVLGLCPTLAVSVAVINGIGMGIKDDGAKILGTQTFRKGHQRPSSERVIHSNHSR
jgi:Na+-transporting NADH:ubiquinone oxidoreductase subunit NqrD